ncbi:STAS domain-containing protein [Streptomyces sp. NPDC087908]|uniref:STAS domain-containing protein n=1 Tax=Streptomyces sp. NPDC087908 TaxID=3365820 RepID=UPI003828CEFD
MRAEDLLHTHTLLQRDTVHLRLAGELDLATTPLLQAAAATAMNTHPRHFHFDLTGLTLCDHTGLHALHQLTHQAHVHLHLTGTHPRLHRTLAFTQQRTPPPRCATAQPAADFMQMCDANAPVRMTGPANGHADARPGLGTRPGPADEPNSSQDNRATEAQSLTAPASPSAQEPGMHGQAVGRLAPRAGQVRQPRPQPAQ